MTYTATRMEDLKTLPFSTALESNPSIKIYDILRVFSGDGPARQFEAGQQYGGNYGCICGVHCKDHLNYVHCQQMVPKSLEERRKIALSSRSLKKNSGRKLESI